MNAPTPLSLPTALAELGTQLERGSLFTHTALGENAARLAELQAIVHGLADTLLARGIIDAEELATAMARADDELHARGEQLGPGTRIRVDADDAAPAPEVSVDCESRLPICQAVCCRLNFALSVPEIEAGEVRWDLGQPYFIRKREDGHCVHHDAETRACGVYAHRPGVCRRYSCAHDERIWSDFEGRVLNTEWIAAHLDTATRPRAEAVRMHFIPQPPAEADDAGNNEDAAP